MHKENIVQIFKDNLVRIRKKRGYTQRQLAKKVGTSQRAVAYYENDAANIPLTKLQDLANALEVSVVELLGPVNGKSRGIEEMDIRIIRKIKQIEKLPRRAQEALWHTINTTLEMHALKAQKKKSEG
jgi:transcriptional regulator with XRE-family HTH domain